MVRTDLCNQISQHNTRTYIRAVLMNGVRKIAIKSPTKQSKSVIWEAIGISAEVLGIVFG